MAKVVVIAERCKSCQYCIKFCPKNVLALDVFDTADLTGYPDYGSISDYARTPLSWAVAQGLILGVGNSNGADTLQPKGDATRAQTATIIMRFCQNVL